MKAAAHEQVFAYVGYTARGVVSRGNEGMGGKAGVWPNSKRGGYSKQAERHGEEGGSGTVQ